MPHHRSSFIGLSLSLSLCTALAAPACGPSGSGEAGALVTLEPLADSGVRGTVEMSQASPEQVRVHVDVTGLTPGLHGFHIHEFGDCSAPDGSSAGGHFNPENVMHGGPGSPERHAGDLGNIKADAEGRAVVTLTTSAFTLDAGPRGVVGRAVVIHADPDDLHSDPAGNAGSRLSCGVIRSKAGATTPILSSP